MITDLHDNPRPSILVLTQDGATANTVRESLANNGHTPRTLVYDEFHDFVTALEVAAPEAALVDIDPDPKQGLAQLEAVISQFGRTRFIVLASQASNELLLGAMQAGARHFLHKDTIPGELAGIVGRLLSGAAPSVALGGIVTVLSAAGGCGATLVAVNLADELHAASESPALVVDMDCHYGAVGSYLGLQGDYGVADVLAHSARIDAQLIQSSAIRYSRNLHALLSPATVDFTRPKALDCKRLDDLALGCRQFYPWTVVDAPRVPLGLAADLAGVSRLTLIICQMSVKDLRTARAMYQALLDRGADPGNLRYVISRYRRRGQSLSLVEAREALDGASVVTISDDAASANDSLNYGCLLSQGAPRSKLRRDIRELAEMVTVMAPTAGKGKW